MTNPRRLILGRSLLALLIPVTFSLSTQQLLDHTSVANDLDRAPRSGRILGVRIDPQGVKSGGGDVFGPASDIDHLGARSVGAAKNLTAPNEKHVVIAGRDRWDPNMLDVETREGVVKS